MRYSPLRCPKSGKRDRSTPQRRPTRWKRYATTTACAEKKIHHQNQAKLEAERAQERVSYPVFGEVAGRQRTEKAGRHVDGLREGQHRPGKVGRDVDDVRHGASVRGRYHRHRHEPDDQNEGDVTAGVANHDAQEARHHLRWENPHGCVKFRLDFTVRDYQTNIMQTSV